MKEPIIGTLNEHTLHLALKNYLEPDPQYHEVVCGNYVADIKRQDAIYEVETRSFVRMKKKLASFLTDNTVTVVYPIAEVKWVVWIDPKTGELSEKHRSPKKGRASDVAYELYKLLPFMIHPNFRLKLLFAEIVDYKRKDGRSRTGKRWATRQERVPVAFRGEMDFVCPADYEKLVEVIPDGVFTAAEFAKANRLRGRYSWYVLQILKATGRISQMGQRGKAFLYERIET